MFLGAHMSTGGGVWRAIERGAGIGCESIQLFVKNNMQWSGRPFADEDRRRFAEVRQGTPVRVVFGHAGYLINLAGPPSPNRDRSIASLIEELRLAASIDLPFLVLHPGAHLGAGEEAGLRRVMDGLNEVFRATNGLAVRVALENTAGQGTCLGHRLCHLAAILQGVAAPQRLAVCLDTAHFFAAGYDVSRPQGWDAALAEAEELFGLEQVVAFHLNDSKGALGSRVDRHAGIGEGRMGREAFRHIVRDARFRNHPGCLETPKSEDLHEDVANLAILRGLVADAGTGRSRVRRSASAGARRPGVSRSGAARRSPGRGRPPRSGREK